MNRKPTDTDTNADAAGVARYIDEQATEWQPALKQLRAACSKKLPGYTESLKYGMPSYAHDGQTEVAFAKQARYLSLYILKQVVLEVHATRLVGLSLGKGCVRYRSPEQIDWDVVSSLLSDTYASPSPTCSPRLVPRTTDPLLPPTRGPSMVGDAGDYPAHAESRRSNAPPEESEDLFMRAKSLLVAGLMATAATAAPVVPVASASASPDVTATYTCTLPILGLESTTVSVVGTASVSSTTITLSKVVFTIKDSFGVSATVNNVRISVPDPNPTSAPFKSGSAKVAATPAGWTAGHNSVGIFALHKGSLSIKNGETIASAALSAKYTNKGPAGTVINFKPGNVTFNLTSPVSGAVSCKPKAPVPTFASVTE